MTGINKKIIALVFGLALIFGVSSVSSAKASGSSLYLAPSGGSFLTGSTFSVSLYVDTKENEINALEVDLRFPPDILQVVSSNSGQSFISNWMVPPSYSNSDGKINFRGGVHGGIKTSAGLISMITFRAKSVGNAKIEILDSSVVLLNDGKGTQIQTNNIQGEYGIAVSPSDGPQINSATHPEPDVWYSDPNPIFSWTNYDNVVDFSYSFSQNFKEVPDTVSESGAEIKQYENIPDGVWYFHIRSKKEDLWGKASHFQVKIDAAKPEEFKPSVDLENGFVYFETKDIYSGIDHSEVSVVDSGNKDAIPFFIEAKSPIKLSSKKAGSYDVFIRVFDKAGNMQEGKISFQIINPFISFVEGKGISIKGIFIPWFLALIIFVVLLLLIIYAVYVVAARKIGFKKGIKEIDEALREIKKIEGKEREIVEMKAEFEEKKKELEGELK